MSSTMWVNSWTPPLEICVCCVSDGARAPIYSQFQVKEWLYFRWETQAKMPFCSDSWYYWQTLTFYFEQLAIFLMENRLEAQPVWFKITITVLKLCVCTCNWLMKLQATWHFIFVRQTLKCLFSSKVYLFSWIRSGVGVYSTCSPICESQQKGSVCIRWCKGN